MNEKFFYFRAYERSFPKIFFLFPKIFISQIKALPLYRNSNKTKNYGTKIIYFHERRCD